MKLLYVGTHFCPADTLSRLFLLGSELCFLDRPSVTFGDWGTVGSDSYMRGLSFGPSPVPITVLKPASGPAHELHQAYVLADLDNPDFVRSVFEGLRSDDVFAERLLQPAGNYGDGRTGVDIRRLLVADTGLPMGKLGLEQADGSLMYKPETPEGRRAIFRSLVVDVSIQITSALLMADKVEALPVADDVTLPKLLALRASSSRYVGGTPAIAPFLGLGFARSVIPDEILKNIEFKGIFAYREKTKDLYDAWNVELRSVAAKIGEAELSHPAETIQAIIASELAPRIREYENEMASARDALFGNIVKGLARWELPTLSLSYVANLGFAGALAVFAAGAQATIPHIVDFVQARRDVTRKHAVSYFVGLTRGPCDQN